MTQPLQQDPIPHTVRRSTRARRVRVVVEPDGAVVVVLPSRSRERDAEVALRELRPWVERKRAEVLARQARMARPEGTVPYLGTLLELREEPGRSRAVRRGDVLVVPAGPEAQGAAIERWYRARAREEVRPRLDAAVAALGRSYTRLTVRDQRTRWGSCSSTGAMSFNWRLLLGPPEVLDYVVWHEACHLVHMDHSPRFWALLAAHRPGYREQQRWLKANGGGLRL